MKWINGKKTYIGMIAGGIIGLLVSMNIITWEQAQPFAVVVGAWTGIAIKHASDKSQGRG